MFPFAPRTFHRMSSLHFPLIPSLPLQGSLHHGLIFRWNYLKVYSTAVRQDRWRRHVNGSSGSNGEDASPCSNHMLGKAYLPLSSNTNFKKHLMVCRTNGDLSAEVFLCPSDHEEANIRLIAPKCNSVRCKLQHQRFSKHK